MRLSGNMLRRLIAEELDRSLLESLIREAEGDEKADKGGDEGGDAADDLFGGGDEPAGDDAAGDEGGDDKEEEEDKEEPVEPTGPIGDTEIDSALTGVLADFERRALDAAAEQSQVKSVTDGRILPLSHLLFEAEVEDEVQFDVATFADDIARLISNYDTLIDMEMAIFMKAFNFLKQKYGDEAADELEDILLRKYQLEFERSDPEASEREVFAAQAGPAGGGAA